ncbi:MAG: hypothetical protein CL582_20240 [Alteromonadaceae bacterium]|nr:hypothetical protein [Alteromonadaceae bacterium]
MAKVNVRVGPKARNCQVEGLPFLPGLCMHRMPSYGKISEFYNITHSSSGLAIISCIEEKNLELIRMILGRMLWDKSADAIFDDGKYLTLVKEAKSVLTNHERSERQEKRIATDTGGKRQPASGSRWGSKRDIITPQLLIEAKTTTKQKQSVSIKDLHFLTKQAYQEGKIPAYVIELGDMSEIAIIPEQDIGQDILMDIEEVRTLNCRTKRSFSVNSDLVNWLIDDNCVSLNTSKRTYTLLNYSLFLEVAKRGLW